MSETTVVNLSDPAPESKPQVSATPVTTPIAPEVPSAATAKPDDMTAKFAALAKKERIARLAQHNAKQKEATLLAREKALEERERLWENEFRQTPLEALKKRNLTYQDLTNAALNDGKFQPETEIKSVKEEIERLRQETLERENKATEAQKKAQEQAESEAIEAFKGKINGHIEQGGEKFELTKLYDATELVFQTVEEHFARTQKILSVDEACGLVETYLESELERTSKASKKFQSKYMQAKEAQSKSEPSKSSVTLTNHMNSNVAPSLLSPKNEEDRIKRALAALG